MLGSLFRSRKFWLTVVNIIILVLGQGFGLEQGLLDAIQTVLMFLVGMIAVEDAARFIGANKA